MAKEDRAYREREELANSISHGLGMVFAIISLILLVNRAWMAGSMRALIGFIIYSISLFAMYSSSTFYHLAWDRKIKSNLRVLDHISIFLFIAGSFTPIAILTLEGRTRIISLILMWTIAAGGIIFKLLTRGNFDKYKFSSLLIYIAMGWISVFLIRPILEKTSINFLLFLIVGGLAYTLGTIFYSNKKIPYNHAIWHIFVLAGSFIHFIGIYIYLT